MMRVGPAALKMMKSFLTDRYTCCKINGKISSLIKLSAGFPEGSCFSPFLWLVTIIDASTVKTLSDMELNGIRSSRPLSYLPKDCPSRSLVPAEYNTEDGLEKTSQTNLEPRKFNLQSVEYSDDISCLVRHKLETELQRGINVIMNRYITYFSCNSLAMNPAKSSLLVFRNQRTTSKLNIMGNKEEKKAKFLGIWFDSMYTFEVHLQKVRKNVLWRLSRLKSVTKFLTKQNRHEMLYAMCMSVLMYGMEVYCRLPGIRKSLQKLQNKIHRDILFTPAKFSATVMMKQLDELNVDNRYRMNCLLHLLKCLRYDTCLYTLGLLDKRARVYQTRNQFLIMSWFPKTLAGIYSFIKTAVEVYNAVEFPKIKFNSQEELKHKLKGIIWEKWGNNNPN